MFLIYDTSTVSITICYPVLVLLEQANCIEWIQFLIYTVNWPKYCFSGT
jgi:hypothetical protein